MATQTISLNRGDSPNLGFRLQGGIDFAQPLVIQKVNAGSPADRAGLKSGDAVIKINNTDVYNLRHKEAQDVIIKAGSAFSITIQRGGSTWRPQVTPTGNLHSASPNSPVTRTSLAAKPQQSIDAIGTGHNVAAKPFLNGAVNGGPKLVNKQYNSPIGIYSEQSIAETITKQSEVLSTGAVGVNFKKNEKNYDATKSAVYSMLQEAEKEPNYSEPEPDTGVVSAPLGSGFGSLKHVEAPVNKPAPPTPQLPPGQNICADCERLIVGVFVRIKDKNLHVECFKCSTCGASLKNVGYYNINNKLYCDVHAKLAAKANPPGPNLVPVTIPPGGKAPASAISSALATHSLPSPGPISPKLGAGPISPSQNITAAPFQNYTNTPKPFSSVAAPLSPNSYSRPLPKTPYQAPPAPAPVLPASPIIAPAAPEKVEIVENIVWPPIQEDITDLPTASPLYFPPSTHVHVKVRHLSDRPQTPYEKINSDKSESRSTTPATAHSTTEKTESDSDYQDLEDYTNFLKNMEPKMSVCSSEVYNINGRRSTLECVETIAEHLQTAMLVDHVMKKRPKSPPPLNQPILKPSSLPAKKEEGPIKPVCPLKCQQSCCNDCPECPMKKPAELRRLSELERFEEMRSKIQNIVPQGWESQMVSALRTTPDKPFCVSPEFAAIPPTKSSKGLLASAMTIAPKEPFCPVHPIIPVFNTEPVPLPKETVPYLPPERPLLPELMHQAKEVKKEIEKPASPFVQALKTAPERPYSPIGHAPTPIRPRKPSDPLLKGLPKPTEKLSMLSALTTASDRTYSPMTVQCEFARDASQQKVQEEEKKKEDEKRKFSIKQPIPQPFIATMVETFEGNPQGGTPQQEFNPISVELQGMAEYHADYEEVKSELNTQINYQQKRAQEMQKEVQQMQAHVKVQQQVYQQQEVQERTQKEVQHEHVCCLHRKQAEQIARQNEEVIIKKPLTLAESLKKSEYIPNYQSALEYDQEIQLPHHKDIKKLLKPHEQSKIIPNPRPLLAADPHHAMATPPPKITAPVTVVSDYKPNTSFQTVNDNFEPPSSAMNQRLGQPSPSRINKPPSAIPYYQQNLVATQFLAPEINVFDPSSPAVSRSPSPCPGAKPERPSSPFRKPPVRPKSPAAGPPPNPLKQHKDHVHFKEDFQTENAKDKITSYIPHHQERFHEIQRREGDHYDHSREVEFDQSRGQVNKPGYQEQTYQGRARQAEAMQSHQVSSQGNMQVSRSEQLRSEQIAQLNKSQAQSVQMSADGRTQVQRKKTVVEEFEQSHKENTIEIQKSYPVKVNQSTPLAREEQQALKGLHVTNPGQIASPFLTQPISGPPPMPKNPIPPAPKAPEPPKPVYKPVQCPVPSKVPVPPVPPLSSDVLPSSAVNPCQSDDPAGRQAGGNVFAPKRGRGVLNVGGLGARIAQCAACHSQIRGPFITALGKIWCPEHFVCATAQCRRPLQDIGFVEEQGQLHCEYCFEQYLAPNCAKCGSKVKGDCLKAIQKNFHPECFSCAHCGKLFGNNPFFLEDGLPYCEADWNEMFTTKCFACGFPVEAGDRWVEALNNNYHTQCFNCTSCKKNLEGQSFYAKGGRPFCKNHAR